MNEELKVSTPESNKGLINRVFDVVHKVALPSVLSSHYRDMFKQANWPTKMEMTASNLGELTGIILTVTGNPLGVGLYAGAKMINKATEIETVTKGL